MSFFDLMKNGWTVKSTPYIPSSKDDPKGMLDASCQIVLYFLPQVARGIVKNPLLLLFIAAPFLSVLAEKTSDSKTNNSSNYTLGFFCHKQICSSSPIFSTNFNASGDYYGKIALSDLKEILRSKYGNIEIPNKPTNSYAFFRNGVVEVSEKWTQKDEKRNEILITKLRDKIEIKITEARVKLIGGVNQALKQIKALNTKEAKLINEANEYLDAILRISIISSTAEFEKIGNCNEFGSIALKWLISNDFHLPNHLQSKPEYIFLKYNNIEHIGVIVGGNNHNLNNVININGYNKIKRYLTTLPENATFIDLWNNYGIFPVSDILSQDIRPEINFIANIKWQSFLSRSFALPDLSTVNEDYRNLFNELIQYILTTNFGSPDSSFNFDFNPQPNYYFFPGF